MPRTPKSNSNSKSNKKGSKKSSSKVKMRTFFALHPYDCTFKTDSFYDQVYEKIEPIFTPMITYLDCTEEIVTRMALCCAAYLEDKVSKLGIWNAFVSRHRELYRQWLPWYDTDDDYDLDKVNLEDLFFLLWMINVSTEDTDFTPPDDRTIERCAIEVYHILIDEFDNAPTNKELRELITSEELTEDFDELMKVLNWMSKMCYIMAVPCWELERRNKIRQDFQRLHPDADPSTISFYEYSYDSLRMRVGPLALYPKEWLVLIREQNGVTKGKAEILSIEGTPLYPFLVLSNNRETVTVRSCRGEDYEVSIDCYTDDFIDRMRPGVFLQTSFALFKGKWEINGFFSFFTNTKEGLSDQEYLEKMAGDLTRNGVPVDILGLVDNSIQPYVPQEVIDKEHKAIEANHGHKLFYFPSLQAMFKWSNSITGEKSHQSNKQAEKLLGKRQPVSYIATKHILYTFPYAEAINDPANPYFDPEMAFLGSLFLYNKFGIPDEFAAYLIQNNYLTCLSFNVKEPHLEYSNLIEDNLHFWATFMRQYPC